MSAITARITEVFETRGTYTMAMVQFFDYPQRAGKGAPMTWLKPFKCIAYESLIRKWGIMRERKVLYCVEGDPETGFPRVQISGFPRPQKITGYEEVKVDVGTL